MNNRLLTVLNYCEILTKNLKFYRVGNMIGNTEFNYEDVNGVMRNVLQYKVAFSGIGINDLIGRVNSERNAIYRLINFEEYTEVCRQGYIPLKETYYVNDCYHVGRYDMKGAIYSDIDINSEEDIKVMLIAEVNDAIVISSEPAKVVYDNGKHKFQLFVEHGEELPFKILSFHDSSSISLSLDDAILLQKELPVSIDSYKEYSNSRNAKISNMEKQILEMQKEIARLKG